MLDTACRLVLEEVSLSGSAPGGKVEFKRTLIISFLFKFYLEVSQILKKMVSRAGYTLTSSVLGAMTTSKVEAMTPYQIAVEKNRQSTLETHALAEHPSACLWVEMSLGKNCK